MKMLMLNYEFPPLGGGSSIANYYILKELAKIEGVEIHLVTSSLNKYKIETFSSSIKIHFLDIGKNGELHFQSFTDLLKYSYKAYRYSKKLIKKENFQLIHAFFGIPSGYIAMKLGLPYIVSLRGSDVPFHTPRFKILDLLLFKRLSKKIWERAKFVVANSKGLREEALLTSPEQAVGVIYNGVDTDEFKPLNKSNDNETLTFISTGRLAAHKGYHFLIQALSGLKGVRLVLVGDGKQYEELKGLAKNLNVMVDFRGKLEHSKIVAELQKADVFVLPSITEGMSNSLLEAIACGLPVLVTNVGGSEELIKDNGFIVEKGNIGALREKIQAYLNDKNLLKEQAKASVEIAKSMSWEKVANQYMNLYSKVK